MIRKCQREQHGVVFGVQSQALLKVLNRVLKVPKKQLTAIPPQKSSEPTKKWLKTTQKWPKKAKKLTPFFGSCGPDYTEYPPESNRRHPNRV